MTVPTGADRAHVTHVCRQLETALDRLATRRTAVSEPEVTVEPTTYEVTAYPFHDVNRDMWVIRVERRAEDSWAVLRLSACWNRRTKAWDDEPMPSSHTEAFKRTHRFPLEQALAIAREQAPKLTVNGRTLAGAIAEIRELAEAAW